MTTSSVFAAPASTSSESSWGTVSTGVGNSGVSGVVITSPGALPVAGTYTSAQSVVLSASGALSIHYTTDGTVPTCLTGVVYSSPVSITTSQTVSAVSCYTNSVSSGVSTYVYVITAPAVSGGGGGGGGGSYTAPTIPTVIATTTATTTGSQVALKAGCSTFSGFSTTTGQSCSLGNVGSVGGMVLGASLFNFTVDLRIGSRGNDVTELQKILIKEGFLTSEATGYFGGMTRSALMKWQAKNGLVVSETFGKQSRDFLNAKNGVTEVVVVKNKGYSFLKDLKIGSRSNDVKELQKILITAKFLAVYPPTDYFGALTQAALKKWQSSNGLTVTGLLDTESRTYLNSK